MLKNNEHVVYWKNLVVRALESMSMKEAEATYQQMAHIDQKQSRARPV